jgi:hypothetical protein
MSYSKNQTMLAFAYMSYYGFDLIGSDKCNAQKIEKDIKHALTSWAPVKDEWELVWGPGVFIFEFALFDDNLMYLVRNIKDPSRYVVGYPEAMGMLDDNDIPVFELFAGQL